MYLAYPPFRLNFLRSSEHEMEILGVHYIHPSSQLISCLPRITGTIQFSGSSPRVGGRTWV